MNGIVPHIVQYQGSKRKLAPQILRYMPAKFQRLIEPFSGMAAITVATAFDHRTNSFIVNDINAPLVAILQEATETPQKLVEDYERVWNEQFTYVNHAEHFYAIREKFNSGETTAANLLYLLARCVKGAVRYGKNGKFNQSPDKRRHGMTPASLEQNVYAISDRLRGKTLFSALDYREILEMAQTGDLVYMDPPYQGVTDSRDGRYVSGVDFDDFVEAVDTLNKKDVDFLISYDGKCGGKEYGKDLPRELGLDKVLLNAGLSSQATLLGKHLTTYESLYISKSLTSRFRVEPIRRLGLEVRV